MIKDALGNEIKVGDVIAVGSRGGGSGYISFYCVTGFTNSKAKAITWRSWQRKVVETVFYNFDASIHVHPDYFDEQTKALVKHWETNNLDNRD